MIDTKKEKEIEKESHVKLFKDTFAEIKRIQVLHEGRITLRELVDRYIRKGLGLPFIDRVAFEILEKAFYHATTNASKMYLKRLEQQIGTIHQAVELSRREMRKIPEDWKENFDRENS